MPDYDDEELELIRQHREKKASAAAADKEVWIKQGDNEAAVPYSKGRSWLQKTFGIDLDDEPVNDAPDPEGKQGQPAAAPKAVQFGRRVG